MLTTLTLLSNYHCSLSSCTIRQIENYECNLSACLCTLACWGKQSVHCSSESFCQDSWKEEDVYTSSTVARGEVSREHFHSHRKEEYQICFLRCHHSIYKSLSLEQHTVNASIMQHTEMERRGLSWSGWLKVIMIKFVFTLHCPFHNLKISTVKGVHLWTYN